MKKFLLFLIPLLFSVCITNAQFGSAEENAALQLVSVNRAVIGLSADDLNNLKVSNSYFDKTVGVRYVYLQQTFRDIPVYNQIQVLAFKNNILVSNAGGRIADIGKKVNQISGIPPVSPESAVITALADKKISAGEMAIAVNTKDNGRKIEFGKMGVSRENITAQLMWVPSNDGNTLHLAWQIYFIPTTTPDYWLVKVDAKNNYVLGSDNLTVYCNWDDPNHTFVFGKNHNHSADIPKSAFGGNNLFDFKAITKRTNEISGDPSLADNGVYRVVPLPFEAPTFMTAPFHASVSNPWTAASANATTLKWHSTDASTDFNYTRGNNVWAYHDRSNQNTGDPARSATSTTALPNLTFDFTPDYTLEPTVTSPPNQQFNITNLFYYNNILHDVLYAYGFDEVGGNFQDNNLARGGAGNDHVNAEAQDGSGSNNANFATPADGGSGRMQMYLWTAPTPDRDGDVDNGIIAHEFGHGVSNRIIGGPTNVTCVSNGEAMGEGISDYYALMFTHRWDTATLNGGLTGRGIGTYALNQPTNGIGIRTQRYSTDFAINNKVYEVVLPSTVHPRGEHWCAAAWEMTWAVIQQSGTINPNIYYNGSSTAGNLVAMRLITQGMKLVPCGPGFIDMRNGILQADTILYGGAYSCSIWEAFRKRGMGAFANQGSANSFSDQTPDFTAKSWVGLTASAPTIPEGSNLTYTNTVSTCSRIAISNLLLTDTLPTNVTFVSATAGGTYNAGNRVVSWPVNQAANSTAIYQFTVTVNAGSFPGNVVMRSSLFDVPAGTRRFNYSEVVTPITPVAPGCPNVTSQPANTTVCNNSTATFSVTATAANTITYQWQVSTTGPGGPWTNLTNAAPYSGVNTATLTINPTALGLNNNQYRCFMVTIDCPAGVNSNGGILSVVAASIGGTVTPANSQVCGTTNSGTLTLSGHVGNIVRWESSTVGAGGPFTPIANTTTTLTFTNITQTTYYRAVVQATGCVEANSSVATVTFVASSPIMIVADPGTTLCEGDPTRLTVHEGGLTGPITIPIGAQTGTFTGNVRGYYFTAPTNFTMTALRVPTDASAGPQSIAVIRFNPAVPPPAFPATTNAFTVLFLTQNNAAAGNIPVNIPIATGDVIGILGQRATVNSYRNAPNAITIAGFPVNLVRMGMQFPLTTTAPQQIWTEAAAISRIFFDYTYGSAGPVVTGGTFLWTPATGLSSTTTNPVAASPMTTTTYTVSHNDGAGCIRQANITITVNQRPTVTTQPASITTCNGSIATFTVGGTGTGLAYQWQVSTTGPGGPWTNLTNVAPYSGVTTATLTVNPVALALSGNNYRAVLSGTCPAAGTNNISNAVVLTVNPLPTVSVTPATGCGGIAGTNGLLLTASGANSYTWAPLTGLYTNATATIAYTGGNTPTVYAAPTVFTTYTVTGVNSTTGCSSTASVQVNYTPPAPTVVPSSVTMCLGDPAVKLKSSSSQSFTSSFASGAVNITIPDGPTIPPVPTSYPAVVSNITASGIPVGATIANVRVRLNVTHAWVSDLVIALKAPNGQVINLSALANFSNSPGANFVNTTFSSASTTAIAPPYTGTYRADLAGATFTALGFTWPGGPISYVPTANAWSSLYSTPNGVWSIGLYDAGAPDGGVFNSWSLDIDYIIGVPATPAVWTPAAGLFSDAAALTPYVAGTAVDSVWTRPTPSGVYTYQATVNSLPPPSVFSNTGVILVPATGTSGPAGPYPANLVVSGLPASGVSVRSVTLSNMNHTWTSDIDIVLQHPDGLQNVILLSDYGGSNDLVNTTLTFDDAAPTIVTNVNPIPSGTYRCTNLAGPDTWPAPGPGPITQVNPTLATFTGNMNGTWRLFANDQVGGDAGNINGGFSINFNLPPSSGCTSPARNIVVTVNQPINITTQPVNQVICTDKVATFSVAATGSGPISYQWQVSTNNGNTYTNIANGGVYSGATSTTLTITAPPVSMNGYYYRCIITGAAPCTPVTSAFRILTVNPLPTIVISASPHVSLFPGLRTTLSSTVTPNPAATYTWFRNGGIVSGASGGTLGVDVDGLGDYILRVTDVNGCTNNSNTITIKDSATGKCFIYPNPSSGQFQVRYYSVANNVLPRSLTVYDAKGNRVITQYYTIGRPYDRMDVDMRKYGKGLYWVEIGDVNGSRLTMCRIVIQ